MALKVKAVERLLKFDKESAGKYRYVMKADLYTSWRWKTKEDCQITRAASPLIGCSNQITSAEGSRGSRRGT